MSIFERFYKGAGRVLAVYRGQMLHLNKEYIRAWKNTQGNN
jgi:hypothetical protein